MSSAEINFARPTRVDQVTFLRTNINYLRNNIRVQTRVLLLR